MIFWTAVAVAVLLLGGGVATVRRIFAGATVGDLAAVSLTVLWLTFASLVAGRIVVVSARAQRRVRRD